METNKDHDILIELNANFKTFIKQYGLDMKELKDNTASQLRDHSERILTIEKLIEQVQPLERVKQIEANTDFREKFSTQVSVLVVIGSFVMYFISQYISGLINNLFQK